MTKVCECCGKEGTRQLVYRNDMKRHITAPPSDMSEQYWCECCGGVILPLASAATVNGKSYHDTDLCNPLRIKDPVANAINHGENRYRQTVLSQGPLPGYPVITYKMCCASAVCAAKLDDQMSDDHTRIAEYHL